MGKRERASFSFVGKSNSGLSSKEKNAADESGEKDEEDGPKKYGKKFWWKMVRFLRRPWSSHGGLHVGCEKKEGPVTEEASFGNWSAVGNGEIGFIEIPVEAGRKISRILVKPTESGIKAMLAQYAGLPLGSAEPPAPGTPARGAAEPEEGRARLVEGARLNWGGEVFGSESEIARNRESLLKSALFIRQEVDVECAVLFEPKQSIQSKRTDEIIQRWRKSAERHLDCEIPDEKGDQMVKTVSEPTWNERRKLLQQQQLKDNINNLLEQFICLEADDIFDLTVSRSGVAKCERRIQFEKSSALGLRRLSREVSPEILVNVKPFKEHVSDQFLTSASSFVHSKYSSKYFPLEQAGRMRDGTSPVRGRASESRGRGERRRREDELVPRGLGGRYPDGTPKAISIMEKEGPGYQGEVSLRLVYDAVPVRPTCTVWGVYRSYSKCEAALTEEESDTEDPAGDNPLLDDVDDADHDLVFQKNIGQFKKKINLMPHLDSSNCVVGLSKAQQKRLPRSDNPKRKLETFRFEPVRPWTWVGKRSGMLATVHMLLGEMELLSRTLATRIEEGAIEWPQAAREIYDMLESGNSTTVEKEVPRRFEDDLKVVPLGAEPGPFGVRDGRFHRTAENDISDSFEFVSETTAVDSHRALPESQPFGARAANRASARDVEAPIASFPPKWKAAEERKLEKAEGKATEAEGRTGKKIKSLELIYEPARSVVRVVCGESCHAVIVCDGDAAAGPAKTFPGCPPEVKARASKTPFRAIEEEAPAAAEPGGRESSRKDDGRREFDPVFDGFQIIYNNSNGSLNDDEEDGTKPSYCRSLTGKKPSFLFVLGDSGCRLAEKRTNAFRCSYEKPTLPQTAGSRTLTFKSNSSPKAQTEFAERDGRGRRFPSRETEKDLANCKKRRLSLEKCVEIRRMGSALAECLGRDGATFVKEDDFGNLIFPERTGSAERKPGEGKKVIVVEHGGARTKKELLVALSSIREMNASASASREDDKGGKRRMSLVILLSKK